MVNSVRQAIVDKLLGLYPVNKVYTDDIPQNFKKPSFIIYLIDQNYGKRMNIKFKSLLSFDVAYYSNKGVTEIKSDCQNMQLALFRAFDLMGTYRVLNKNAETVDNVLHFTFDINYSEMKVEIGTPMQTQTTTINN